MRFALLALLLLATQAAGQSRCHTTSIVEPQPFLGTADEIIVLADGSVWKDVSYKYLYLYAYLPTVVICPSRGRMYLDDGADRIEFTLVRLR